MNAYRIGAAVCLAVAVFATVMGTIIAAAEAATASAAGAPVVFEPPVTVLLILIAALLLLLTLVGVAALLTLRVYAVRTLDVLYDVSDEHLPAIRGAVSDVVDHLIPPGGAR